MALKNINITPNTDILSPAVKDLFAKFNEANDADESQYYQQNTKATEVCTAIRRLESLESTVRSCANHEDAVVRANLYENIKKRAHDLLAACDSKDTEAHLDLPKKSDVLTVIGNQIAAQMTKDLDDKYLCFKPNYNHTVTIIRVSSVKFELCTRGGRESNNYSFDLKFIGYGVERTDEHDCWAPDDRILSFGKFTVSVERHRFQDTHADATMKNFSMGTVTAKQFADYIAKATKEQTDAFGLNKELFNGIK